MATERKPGVRPDPRRNGKWQIRFRMNGQQYTKTVETEREANRRAEAIDERKSLVKARKIAIPPGVDVGEWLFTDGQREISLETQDPWGWGQFRQRYENEVIPGLANRTADKIATVFNAIEKALPRVAKGKLADLNPEAISRFQAFLRNGKRSENTIAGYLAHLRAALAWAHEQGMISTVPKIKRPQRAKKGGKGSKSKGPGISGEEFERLVGKIPAALVESRHRKRAIDRKTRINKGHAVRPVTDPAPVEVPPATVESWRHYLTGLWLSGLRLAESLVFYWDRGDGLRVELDGRRPMLRIPAECEKGHRDRLLPMTPDFAEYLLRTPEADRRGPVFRPLMLSGNPATATQAGRMVALMGELAGVVVNTDPKTNKRKFASAHDLRRSFGNRWAKRVMPAVLQKLMRHESIQTTMGYYVDLDADELAEDLYRDYGQAALPALDNSSAGGKPRNRKMS
jgi:integrase